MQYGVYASQFLGRHFVGLVQQDGVAELYLLDNQVGYVVLGNGLAGEVQAAAKLVLQSQCVHYGADAVQSGDVCDGTSIEGVQVQ